MRGSGQGLMHVDGPALSLSAGALMLWLALCLAPTSVLGAKAWFGVEMPESRQVRSERVQAARQSPDFAALTLQPAVPPDAYAAIRGEEILRHLQDIVEITARHRPAAGGYWGRIAGTPAEPATADYMLAQFRRWSLADVHAEPVQGGPQWWPVAWAVTLVGDPAYGEGTADYPFSSAFPALQLQGKPLSVKDLEAELVYVGQGHPVDLLDRDVRGKVAVVHATLQPDTFFQTARGYIDGIVSAGAVGVVTVMDAPGNFQYALEDMGPPEVPCFVMGGDDGRFLEDVMTANASRPLRVRLSLQTEIRESWSGKNALATVPGKSDEFVVLLAHLDGYFESANDNGGGLASMLALAKYYASPGVQKPNRSLLFLATSGHHEFSDGVTAFISRHPEILGKTAVVMNLEHPSSAMTYYRGALKFHNMQVPGQLSTVNTQGTRSLTVSNGNPLLIDFYRKAIDRYGLVIDDTMENRPPTGDAFGFFKARQVVVQILDSNIWYHSSGDRIDLIQPVGLERATRLFADVLDQIDRSSRAELSAKGAR